MTLSEAFAMYCVEEIRLKGKSDKTGKNYMSTLSCFTRHCGDIPIELVSYETVIRWKLAMEYQGIASSTISGNLSNLRQVLKFFLKRGLNVLNPLMIELPRIIITERDYVTPDEAKQMIACAIRPRDKALIATLWSSGGRISEVLSLNKGDIMNNKAHVVGKNSKLVTLRIDSSAQRYINEYLETRRDRLPAMFISSQMRRITVQRAEQIVNQIAGELGFTRPDGTDKNITPHTFRHGYATDLLTNGADLVTAQKLLGHSSINSTKIYMHVSEPRQDENYTRFHSV
jgi:site-specific recombinase XerD